MGSRSYQYECTASRRDVASLGAQERNPTDSSAVIAASMHMGCIALTGRRDSRLHA
ncbi:MAG: hypothetical protein ACI85K_002697 [Hyphomicrobiaceae bacterium]|jgi:hypothetical protein